MVPLERKKKKSVMNTRIFVFVEVSFALFHVEMKPLKLPVTQQGSRQSKGGLRSHIIYSKVSEIVAASGCGHQLRQPVVLMWAVNDVSTFLSIACI